MQSHAARRAIEIALLPTAALALPGCRVIGGIFKAGFWVGAIAVAFMLAVAFGLVRMLGSR